MTKKVGWAQAGITSGGKEDRYKAEEGREDIIKVMTECEEQLVHWTGSYSAQCAKEAPDDPTECPNCNLYGSASAKPRYGCLIIYLATRNAASGRLQLVGKAMYWGFGADKYKKLYAINLATKGKMMERDLIITCEDTKYQKINIVHKDGQSVLIANKKKYGKILKTFESAESRLYQMFMAQKTAEQLSDENENRSDFPGKDGGDGGGGGGSDDGDALGEGEPSGDGGGGGEGGGDEFEEAHDDLMADLE